MHVPKPRLTHFIALPIGQHASLRTRLAAFTGALLAADPPVRGLHESIVINPRRLHLTLGVMALDTTTTTADPGKGLADAIACLQGLRPRILQEMGGQKLKVPLTSMDIMRPDRGDLEHAHVLWAGPAKPDKGNEADTEYDRLDRVARLINSEFRRAGLVVDEKRALKLHCTVLNTIYRKPRTKGPRAPFSYAAVLASPAFADIAAASVPGAAAEAASVEAEVVAGVSAAAEVAAATENGKGKEKRTKQGPVRVDLGTWSVDEVQICEMGSHGPEGEYVCVGKIALEG